MSTVARRPRLRALVLAAGHGTRLRPLTHALPKPLLPIAGEPVAGRTLRRLRAAGCEAAVLNLHHLGDAVAAEFGRSWHGLPLEYSREPEIQGTLGALDPPREFLARADAVVVVNGDSLCRWPIEALWRRHRKTGADVTLLLLRREPDEALGGGVGVDASGRVVALRDLPGVAEPRRRHVFAGAWMMSPRALERVEPGFGDVVEGLWQPLLRDGARIESVTTGRSWHDLGTPGRYLEAVLDTLGANRPSWHPLSWFSDGRPVVSALALVDPAAELRRASIERGAVIERGARVERSLVLEGARIGAGSRIHRCIVGPGVRLPASTEIEKRMICRADRRHELGPGESVLADLVYTPL